MSLIRWLSHSHTEHSPRKVGGVKRETFGRGDMDAGRCASIQHYNYRNSCSLGLRGKLNLGKHSSPVS
jgi:hypothetical protein